MSNEPNKIIYSMVRVSKLHDKRAVLTDISLSYFYGAKIGVLGLNGSGKSSLLRILAGVDSEFEGETILSTGHTIGFLEQEPQLEAGRTVREIVEQGAGEAAALLAEYNQISERFAEPMSDDEMTKLVERQGDLQERIDAAGAWDLSSRLEMAMTALGCPPGDSVVDLLSGSLLGQHALLRLAAFGVARVCSRQLNLRGTLPLMTFVLVFSGVNAIGSSLLTAFFASGHGVDSTTLVHLVPHAIVNAIFAVPVIRLVGGISSWLDDSARQLLILQPRNGTG